MLCIVSLFPPVAIFKNSLISPWSEFKYAAKAQRREDHCEQTETNVSYIFIKLTAQCDFQLLVISLPLGLISQKYHEVHHHILVIIQTSLCVRNIELIVSSICELKQDIFNHLLFQLFDQTGVARE